LLGGEVTDAPAMLVVSGQEAAGSGVGSLLEVDHLRVWFPIHQGLLSRRAGWMHAVEDVSFSIEAGTTLALVGESGSGKSTIARSIVAVQKPTSGSIRLDGMEVTTMRGADRRRMRRRLQMVFQDPYSSLDPRRSIRSILTEPLKVHQLEGDASSRRERVAELLRMVGLDPALEARFPHEFSGGQRQRIGIARALAVRPDLVVCDEPVSSLDVSIQAQILNLLKRLQRELDLSYLFIAHDLAVVRQVADAVAVIYLGKLVEYGSADAIYASPGHPYTRALLSTRPVPDVDLERSRERITLRGEMPSPEHPPAGCHFHTRCWLRERLGNPGICVEEEPLLASVGDQHDVACHFADDGNLP
jgi:oligopeptide/dipeptide ABC transporter ATP-binding protein